MKVELVISVDKKGGRQCHILNKDLISLKIQPIHKIFFFNKKKGNGNKFGRN